MSIESFTDVITSVVTRGLHHAEGIYLLRKVTSKQRCMLAFFKFHCKQLKVLKIVENTFTWQPESSTIYKEGPDGLEKE